jgi:hypothetical protein
MPVEAKGVIELRKALNKFAPDLAKELTSEITSSLKVIQSTARGFVPSVAPGGLYNWNENSKGRAITAKTSMFRTFNTEGRLRMFPLYDAATIKRGIVYRTGYGKPNSKGFRSLFRVKNSSAAGAIYETAGRKNPQGDPASKSNNPGAGKNFVSRQGALYGRKRDGQDMRGRVLFRAWEQDEGKQTAAIFKAIDTATIKLNKRATVSSSRESA